MKKLLALLLSLILVFSLCSISAFADDITDIEDVNAMFKDANNEELTKLMLLIVVEMRSREMITADQGQRIVDALSNKPVNVAPEATEYSFGQGTFVVGLDLKAGTYDITCETSSGNDMDSSIAGLSDFYASQGMSDYADMFNSMSGMYDTIGGLTVMTYKPNTSYYDQYLTLKVGETARIILEDGGKIEISDGTAKLVWIR